MVVICVLCQRMMTQMPEKKKKKFSPSINYYHLIELSVGGRIIVYPMNRRATVQSGSILTLYTDRWTILCNTSFIAHL